MQLITDPTLVHRITTVLRLAKDEHIILFDATHNITALIRGITPKKNITIELISLEKNPTYTPTIIWGLPLLKREAFENALYSLVEMGVQVIQPLLTQKTAVHPGSIEKNMQRWHGIMIAAAEQSKQFSLAILNPLLPLHLWLEETKGNKQKFFLEPEGRLSTEIIALTQKEKADRHIIITNGPEGDFSDAEKELLNQNEFIPWRLTPTVLRAEQAVAVGIGIMRSLNRKNSL